MTAETLDLSPEVLREIADLEIGRALAMDELTREAAQAALKASTPYPTTERRK
jgi:hypothetical protein